MNSKIASLALSGLSLLAGLCFLLMETHIILPLRLILFTNVYTVESVDSRSVESTLGLSGLEIEELRALLGESASITPYRVSNSEIRSRDGTSFQHLLRLGRNEKDLHHLIKTVRGLDSLLLSRCIDPRTVPGTEATMRTVDGAICNVVSSRLNPWVLKLLSGRQDLGLISMIGPKEAYFHPDNIVYRAIVIPKDDAPVTEKRIRDTISSYRLARPSAQLLGAKHILKATPWRETFFASQKVFIILILVLALTTLTSGLIATSSLGLSRGVLRKRQEWIRTTLGEMPQVKLKRLLRENLTTFCVCLLLIIGGTFGIKWALRLDDWYWSILAGTSISYLIVLLACFTMGLWLASARLPMGQLMGCAIALQLSAFSVCSLMWAIQHANLKKSTESLELQSLGKTVAWRVTLDSRLVPFNRWKAELSKIHQELTGWPGEAAYIYPLPTDQPLGVVLSAPNSPMQTSLVVRTFDTTRSALKLLGIRCTETEAISDFRMEKSILLTESVNKSLYGVHQALGSNVRYLGADYQVIGICQDPHWNSVPSVFLFEPINWAYLLFSTESKGKGSSILEFRSPAPSSPAWEFSTAPKRLSDYWIDLFVSASERIALLRIMTGLAFASAVIGLIWFLAAENKRVLPVSAIRLALGGQIPLVAWQMSWPISRACLFANLAGIGIALCAEAASRSLSYEVFVSAAWLAFMITSIEIMVIYTIAVVFLFPSAYSNRLVPLLNGLESMRRM